MSLPLIKDHCTRAVTLQGARTWHINGSWVYLAAHEMVVSLVGTAAGDNAS